MATLKDIAQKVNLSISTISRVLSQDETIIVSDDTRQAIIEAAQSLNYIPLCKKTRKKEAVTTKIGIALMFETDMLTEDIYYLVMKNAVEELNFAADNEIVLLFRNEQGDFTPSHEVKLNGIFAIGRFSVSEIKSMERLTKNIVFMDSAPDEGKYCSVVPNYALGVKKALDYFIEKGHKEIGFLGSKKTMSSLKIFEPDPRFLFFQQYLTQKEFSLNPNYLLDCEMNSLSSYQVMKESLKTKKYPTALFVSSDVTANGLIRALLETGLKVPKDISIITFNNTSISENLELDSIGVNIKANAKAALNLINHMLSDDVFVPQKITVSCYLTNRKSVKNV